MTDTLHAICSQSLTIMACNLHFIIWYPDCRGIWNACYWPKAELITDWEPRAANDRKQNSPDLEKVRIHLVVFQVRTAYSRTP